MNLIDMYSSKVNSPVTTLTSSLTSVAAGTIETVDIADTSSLPAAPGIATIGVGPTAETIKYTDITGSTLTIERGFEGPTGNWTAGTPIGRFFTSYDYESLKGNIESLNSEINIPSSDVMTTTKSIESLPVDAKGMAKVGSKGQTIQNLIEGGDFSDEVNEYTTVSASLSVSDNIATLTNDGTSVRGVLSWIYAGNSKDQFIARVRVTNSECDYIQLRSSDGTFTITLDNPEQDKWYTLSGINETDDKTLQLRHYYADTTTSNGKSMEIDGNFGVWAISKTALGIEDYTEEQMLDSVRNANAGTTDFQFAQGQTVRSRGKNLLDKFEYGAINSGGFNTSSDITIRSKFYEKIDSNNQYTFSLQDYTNQDLSGMYFYDGNKNMVGSEVFSAGQKTYTPTPETVYIRQFIRFSAGRPSLDDFMNINKPQLEKGTIATTYEPYKESLQFHTLEKKRLPNGVADDEEYQRVSDEYVFDGSEGWENYENGVGVNSDLSRIEIVTFCTDNNIKYPFVSEKDLIGLNNDYIFLAGNNSTIITNGVQVANDGDMLLYVETSLLPTDDLAGFTTYLSNNPVKAIFQLVEPIQRKENLQPLQLFENGTIDIISDYDNFIPMQLDIEYPTNAVERIDSNSDGINTLAENDVRIDKKIENSFHADPQKYYGNVKTIEDGQSVSDWTPVVGPISQDTTNVKIGNGSIKLLEPSSVATTRYTNKNNISLDLSKLNNGDFFNDDDYIVIVAFISNVLAVQGSENFQITFDQNATNSGVDTITTPKKSLVTGWNYLKIKKSECAIAGNGAWTGIQSMRFAWRSNDGYADSYISLQSIQLAKKDPIADYPNPLQVNGVRDFATTGGEWSIFEEFGSIKFRDFISTPSATLYGEKKYNDFVSSVNLEVLNDLYCRWVSYRFDADNKVQIQYNGTEFLINNEINGVVTQYETPGTISNGDILRIKFERKGTTAKVEIYKNKSSVPLVSQIITCTNKELILAFAQYLKPYNILSASITEISHAHHSDIAETAKSLIKQPYLSCNLSTNQSIPTNSFEKIVFNSFEEDDSNMLNQSTGDIVIRESGLYNIISESTFVANTNGYRISKILINGSDESINSENAMVTGNTTIPLNKVMKLAKDDVLTIEVFQNTGSSLDINDSNSATYLTIAKVGE